MQIHVAAAVTVTVQAVKAVQADVTVTVQAVETVDSRPILTVMNNAGTVTGAAGAVTAPIDTVNLILTVMSAVMITAVIVASKGHRSSSCGTAARNTIHVFYAVKVSVTDCKEIKPLLFIYVHKLNVQFLVDENFSLFLKSHFYFHGSAFSQDGCIDDRFVR